MSNAVREAQEREMRQDRVRFAFLAALKLAGVSVIADEDAAHKSFGAGVEYLKEAGVEAFAHAYSNSMGRYSLWGDIWYRAMVYQCASVEMPNMNRRITMSDFEARGFLEPLSAEAQEALQEGAKRFVAKYNETCW